MHESRKTIKDLPNELIDQILKYLEPADILVLQSLSKRLCKVARDCWLWRFQCYHDSPQTTARRVGRLSWSQALARSLVREYGCGDQQTDGRKGTSSTDRWDLSDLSEQVDWYSEYVARHAPLSACWLSSQCTNNQDVRGVACYEDCDGKKVVGPLADGSMGVWSLDSDIRDPSRFFRIGDKHARSQRAVLLDHSTSSGDPSRSRRALAFTGVAEGVSVDAARQRAYVAVGSMLNEVDLNGLQVISHVKYASTITALSGIQSPHEPLTLGTSSGLHILDPRSPPSDCSRSSSAAVDHIPDDAIAFLRTQSRQSCLTSRQDVKIYEDCAEKSRSSSVQLESAPLSILHQAEHSIMAAGRFPSILSYDRRFFPRLEYVIHSSARLSALAYLPFPLRGVTQQSSSNGYQGTLISCGEYNGCGSLELYSVPYHTRDETRTMSATSSDTVITNTYHHHQQPPTRPGTPYYKNRQSASSSKLLSVANHGTRIAFSDADGGLKWIERDGRSIVRRWNINSRPHQQKSPNRVSGHSMNSSGESNNNDNDNDNNININITNNNSDENDHVIRKILPTGPGPADDLLVWTGDRVGLVSLGDTREPDDQPFHDAKEHLITAADGSDSSSSSSSLDDVVGNSASSSSSSSFSSSCRSFSDLDIQRRAQEYDRQMRRALERQADELNWMQRFGGGGGGGGGGLSG